MPFSRRWNLNLSKDDQKLVLDLPPQILQCYQQAGVTLKELETLLHLASFKPDRKGSRCDPGLRTPGERLGLTYQGASKRLKHLERKGLLTIQARTKKHDPEVSDSNLYDFSGFVQKCLEVWEGGQKDRATKERVKAPTR